MTDDVLSAGDILFACVALLAIATIAFAAWSIFFRRRSPSRNVVAYKRETTVGKVPTGEPAFAFMGGGPPLKPATGVMRKAPAEVWGDADFDCPKCGAPVTTRDGNQASRGYLFGFGIPAVVTMTGVLCGACRSSYTVELTEAVQPIEGPITTSPAIAVFPSEGIRPTSAYRRWLEAPPVKSPDLDPATEDAGAEPD